MLKEHARQIKTVVGFVLFIGTIFYAISSLTYLLRGNSYGYNDRISVVGLKEEAKDSIDVIYIGGSAAFVYWEPLKAYQDCGFTSYDLATNTIQAESILAYIKYAQKYQDPDLYIIGVRSFQYYSEQGDEMGLRITSDSMDIGLNRMSLIHKYLVNREMDTQGLALYWDLVKYHTNNGALSNPTAWKLIDNSTKCDYKGGLIQTAWCYLEQPEGYQTEERAKLIPENEKTLKELLDYCKGNDLNVLFVVCPYSISSLDYSIYNTIGDIVSSYGYNFINTNDYYKEMGIDFSQDLYNFNHVNSLGAEKYTAYLESYLMENYSLPDHRNDERYAEWNRLAQEFINRAEESKSSIRGQIADADEGIVLGETIRNTTDFKEWATLVNDSRYSMIVVGSGQSLLGLNYCDMKLVDQLGMADMVGKENCIEILTSGTLTDSNIDGKEIITANIGRVPVPCVADVTNQMNSICIDGKECSQQSQEGLNIVVFDNHYRTIIDSIVCSGIGRDIHIFR